MNKYFLSLVFLIFAGVLNAQLPIFQWAKAFVAHNQYNPTVYSNGRSVAVDQQGNVYSAGLFQHTTDFDPGPGVFALSAANWANTAIYISKLNANGDFLWAIQIPTYVEFGNIEIRVDKNNNVYIASELRLTTDFDPGPAIDTLSPTGGWDAFVAKYDPNGNLIWAKQFGGPGDTVPRSDVLEIDNGGNVIVCGNFNNTVDFDPGPAVYNLTSSAHIQSFIVKLTGNGDFLWAKQFGNSSVVYSGCNIADIKCDLQGKIYVVGDFSGTCDFDPGPSIYQIQSVGINGYAAKLDGDGNFIWAKSIISTSPINNPHTETRGVDVDASQNVYITGDFIGSFDFDPGAGTNILSGNPYDWYLLKLNAQGDFAWVDRFGGSEGDFGADVAVGLDGSVYSIGPIGHVADMDPGPAQYIITTKNQYGASALVKVDANGALISAVAFDEAAAYGSCLTRRMVLDNLQNIYITGYVVGVVDFDPGPNVYPLSSGGTEAPFVLKLAKCTNVTSSLLDVQTCDSFMLNGTVFDSSGVYKQVIPNSTGCDSIITLQLTITKSVIRLEKTICEGEAWMTGGQLQTTAGIYTDSLLSTTGCDSVVITTLHVNPAPKPGLGQDKKICEGQQLILSPGNFSSYSWQDSSTSNTTTATKPGTYSVTVYNSYNCPASDTMFITGTWPSPANFLPASDSICSYEDKLLRPGSTYNNYQWSSGETTSSLSIKTAGIYWLTVTDQNGCTGRDSIAIYQKQCMKGVFVPTAFTPNHDGKNDLFKALVSGNIKSFSLRLYDRWGKPVFETTDPSKGWNGFSANVASSTTVFVWQCVYQFEGEKQQVQKGTLTLIR